MTRQVVHIVPGASGRQVGAVLRRFRLEAGMTQKQTGLRMGTSQAYVANVEAGRAPAMGIRTLIRHAAAVGYAVQVRLVPGRRRER